MIKSSLGNRVRWTNVKVNEIKGLVKMMRINLKQKENREAFPVTGA